MWLDLKTNIILISSHIFSRQTSQKDDSQTQPFSSTPVSLLPGWNNTPRQSSRAANTYHRVWQRAQVSAPPSLSLRPTPPPSPRPTDRAAERRDRAGGPAGGRLRRGSAAGQLGYPVACFLVKVAVGRYSVPRMCASGVEDGGKRREGREGKKKDFGVGREWWCQSVTKNLVYQENTNIKSVFGVCPKLVDIFLVFYRYLKIDPLKRENIGIFRQNKKRFGIWFLFMLPFNWSRFGFGMSFSWKMTSLVGKNVWWMMVTVRGMARTDYSRVM